MGSLLLVVAMLSSSVTAGQPFTPATDGIRQYLEGRNDAAIQTLAREHRSAPADTGVLLFLGLAHLRANDLAGGIDAWARLLAVDPEHPQAADLRRHLTALRREVGKARVRHGTDVPAPDPRAVAVLGFAGSGSSEAPVLAKGLAQMLVTDLARVPELVVVDRVEVEATLRELRLAGSVLSRTDLSRAARLVRAARASSGELTSTDDGDGTRARGVLTDVPSGVNLGAVEVEDDTDEFFVLQKEMLFGLLAGLGFPRERLPAALREELDAYHTTSFEAFRYFSLGLDALDDGDYELARQRLRQALDEDEDFDLARRMLLIVPFASFGIHEIVAAVEGGAKAGGIGSTGAGAGAAAASVASGAAAAVPESTLSVGTTVLALGAGGLVLGGAGAAVLLLSNDSGSSPSSQPPVIPPPPSAPVNVEVVLPNRRR